MPFKISEARAGYGYRIWVDTGDVDPDATELLNSLKRLSMWNGHDKSNGTWIAYEFDFLGYTGAVAALGHCGYLCSGFYGQ